MRTKSIVRISFLLVLGLVLGVVMSCEQDKKVTPTPKPAPAPTPKPENTGPVVSWDDHSDYCVRIQNNTAVDLVAFKGTIQESNLLSGVKAFAIVGLKKVPALFTQTSDFPLQFITKEQYEANKNNLSALRNQAYTSCYAFYNTNSKNEVIYSISSYAGGEGQLRCQNMTPYNIELRLDSPNGEILGYVPAQHANFVLNVNLGDLTVFPVVRRYSPVKKEVFPIKPANAAGQLVHTQFGLTATEKLYNLDLKKLWDQVDKDKYTTGGCYITIDNQNDSTGVVFKIAGQEAITSMGIVSINSGKNNTYFLPFPDVTVGGGLIPTGFTEEKTFNLSIGTRGGSEVPVGKDYKFRRDHTYIVTVGGANSNNITVTEVKPHGEPNKVDVEKALFGEGGY